MSTLFIYIANISILIAAGYWFCSRLDNALSKHFWIGWIYKNVCGLALGLLFYQHYGVGDTISFYDQASQLANLKLSDFVASLMGHLETSQAVRAIYFVRMVAVLKFLTHADYWLLSMYFSSFSLMGSFYLVNKLSVWRKGLTLPALIAFIYFPSVVFWSSGLLKESLVFGCLALLVGNYFSWLVDRFLSKSQWVIGVLSFLIIVALKYYIAAVLIPVMLYLIVYHLPIWKSNMKSMWSRSLVIAAMLLIPMLAFLTWLSPNLNYDRLWGVMQENHDLYLQMTPDGAVHILSWFDNTWDILINIPYLWFSGIFRPLFGEDFSFPAVFSGLENLLLLLGAMFGLFSSLKHKINWNPELLAVLIYVSTLSIFLCFSAPNFGTLARFKVYYMPFIILIVTNQLQSLGFFKNN